MATQLTLRKGTKIQNDAFTGAEAELTYDSTSKGLRVHDGSTQGGIEVPTANTADYVVESQLPTADNNYTWYRKYKSGWVEQGGRVQSTSTDYQEQTITFPVEMADIGYMVTITPESSYGNTMDAKGFCFFSPTTTSMKVAPQKNTITWGNYWKVEGMAA